MNAPLYNFDILRLAASNPCNERLSDPMGSAERRSPVCGSCVAVDIDLDAGGRVAATGMAVTACAFGQASATLLAQHAVGRTPEELGEARDALAAWLDGGAAVPDWPGVTAFIPALPHTARHAAIRLAFEAAAEAAVNATTKASA